MIPILAQVSLFDSSHLAALLFTLGGVAVLMIAIRILGLALAATHPNPVAPPVRAAAAPSVEPQPADHRLLAVIAAATHEALGRPHRILSVAPAAPPSVEYLMQQWSMEGRRAIYSSHRVR